VPALQAIIASGHHVVAVYTQPDRPAGRGRRLTASAVKECALEHGLVVRQPVSMTDPMVLGDWQALGADVAVVAAYGLLLPPAVLATPRYGCINIHASLLPRWRGAAPIQRAILSGDSQTGICIMQMETGLDTGPILSREVTPIGERETTPALTARLATLGARALLPVLDALPAKTVTRTPQSAEGVCYAPKVQKAEALIDWRASAVDIDRRVRAFHTWPVAETTWQGVQLRVHDALPLAVSSGAPAGEAGEILSVGAAGMDVATGHGILRLHQLQLAGRTVVSALQFAQAEGRSRPLVGQRLGGMAS
jgi:methionyl-tRNA formyltransferase